jgi:hypothetical protein
VLEAYGFGPFRRITRWMVVANALFALWLFRAVVGGPMVGCQNFQRGLCSASSQVVANPGFSILMLWLIADVILAVVWLLTRPHEHSA